MLWISSPLASKFGVHGPRAEKCGGHKRTRLCNVVRFPLPDDAVNQFLVFGCRARFEENFRLIWEFLITAKAE